MSDPGKGHVSLNLPDLNKNFRTDPVHIPRIQERSSRDRVEPVELSKAILERMIGCSSGMVKDQPSFSFVAFDPEMDSALLFVSQNGECHVVPTHEDGSSNFLEQLSLLPKLLKLPGEHESVYMWVLSCSLFHKYSIRQYDVIVPFRFGFVSFRL